VDVVGQGERNGSRSGGAEGGAAMSDEKSTATVPQHTQRLEAIRRLRAAYEDIYHLSRLPLAVLNKGRTGSIEYRSHDEYIRELFARANAIGSFAVGLGIIGPDDQLDAMYEFSDNHPELAPRGWEPGERRAALHQQHGREPE
jgi:hypothetical protein